MKEPKTLQQAVVYFSDPDRAFEFAKNMRWPDGNVVCPRCGVAKNSFVKTRRLWFCYSCKKQFTIKVKTIMEDSPISLDKWMTAFWLLANAKNGISSHELGRTIGVTQTTAWFILQRVREVMKGTKSYKFGGTEGGPVESDETFIGPVPQKMHRSRRLAMRAGRGQGKRFGYVAKTAVFGVLDRGLRQVRANVVPDVKRETLQNAILDNVEHGSTVYTDCGVGFDHLHRNFVHEVVNHAQEYVKGQVHTQGLENFWSLLKRTLRGTYVAVEPFHLDRYLSEQVFRFNNRATKDNPLNDSDRFLLAMSNVFGKRLTYSELTGKNDSPRHEATGAGETQVPF